MLVTLSQQFTFIKNVVLKQIQKKRKGKDFVCVVSNAEHFLRAIASALLYRI